MSEAGGDRMTLVFGLSALQRLRRPAESVADARRWSERAGVAENTSPEDVTTTVERADVEPDFVSGEGGVAGSLAAVRQRFSTDRHVFVGASEDDRGIAQALGWEYLSVEDAAERAGWEFADDADESAEGGER